MRGLQEEFQAAAWQYYRSSGRRDLLWRQPETDGSVDPYKIMVSELMLQQTQVSRVIPKYEEFLRRFPKIETLANAPLGDVLRAWNGLGYNRRAKFLHQAARQIMHKHDSRFPDTEAELVQLAGIGPATASAILVYAFNQPVVFIETNIRTVYIHHFFNDQTDIPDTALVPLVKQSLDAKHPREWYWALMDYGSHLKRTVGNLSRHSKTYNKQSKFEGSLRQIRGQVIRSLGTKPRRLSELQTEITDKRLDAVIVDLVREGLIQQHGNSLSL
jgi:A/G-specific adenine glycosylase